MRIKDIRKLHGLTQEECAKYLNIPLRTYKRYETDEEKIPNVKRAYIFSKLDQLGIIDEEFGVLSIDIIKGVCSQIFRSYDIEYCYLFGSYAKGTATEKSDVDLLVCTKTTGLAFYGLVEALRQGLKKQVDVLTQSQIRNNYELTDEILKEGIRIYG